MLKEMETLATFLKQEYKTTDPSMVITFEEA